MPIFWFRQSTLWRKFSRLTLSRSVPANFFYYNMRHITNSSQRVAHCKPRANVWHIKSRKSTCGTLQTSSQHVAHQKPQVNVRHIANLETTCGISQTARQRVAHQNSASTKLHIDKTPHVKLRMWNSVSKLRIETPHRQTAHQRITHQRTAHQRTAHQQITHWRTAHQQTPHRRSDLNIFALKVFLWLNIDQAITVTSFVYETNIDFFYSRTFQHLFWRFGCDFSLTSEDWTSKIEDWRFLCRDISFQVWKQYCWIEHFKQTFLCVAS